MRRGRFFLTLIFITVSVQAEKFDEFLESLQSRLPMNTAFMQWVLKTQKTKLAHPSILEKWGLINGDAAATYNGPLNTIVLKEEYTAEYINAAGKKSRRVKTLMELIKSEPVVWSLRSETIFHELSHAEFDWLPRSKEPADLELVKFLTHEFEAYLKSKQPQYNASERVIARSELFAYFRADFLNKVISTIADLQLENGYFETSKTCKNTPFFRSKIESVPRSRWLEFITISEDENFTNMPLPIVFVKGKEAIIDPNDPITPKLKKLLWSQLSKHFANAHSKGDVIRWMNTRPFLLGLISPCRKALIGESKL